MSQLKQAALVLLREYNLVLKSQGVVKSLLFLMYQHFGQLIELRHLKPE